MTLSNAAHKAEKKDPLQGECWREKTDCLSHSITFHFQPLLQFRLCRGGWFTDMKMFHMPSVCSWNRTVSRLGDTRALLWLLSIRSLGNPTPPLQQSQADVNHIRCISVLFFILCFVFLPGTCPFFGTTVAEDFIPSALGRQSDATHMCRANFIATCAR